jgi:UDP-N-acetylmuramate dehydrogenase
MSGQELQDRLGPLLAGIRGGMSVDSPMSRLTWFRVGGPADLLFQPADTDDLAKFLEALPDNVPVTVIGVGSNLLVRDGGIEGVVIRLSAKGFGKLACDGTNRIHAGAAVPDKRLAAFALEQCIGGLNESARGPAATAGFLAHITNR